MIPAYRDPTKKKRGIPQYPKSAEPPRPKRKKSIPSRIYTALTEDPEWLIKHPNLYGLYGAAKGIAEAAGKVGHAKYADPYEVAQLIEKPPEEQRRQLLMDTLEDVTFLAFALKGHIPAKVEPRGIPSPTASPAVPSPKILPETQARLFTKVKTALKKSTVLRRKQEQIYSVERAKRLGKAEAVGQKMRGERAYTTQLKKLEGELDKVEFASIRKDLTQRDIDDLFNIIEDSPNVMGWDNMTTKKGLARLLGYSKTGGARVPTETEISLLRRVFPSDLVETILSKRSIFQKLQASAGQGFNIPRSIMSSFDFSAPLRQGIFFVGRPKQFFPAFMKMFKQAFSEKAFAAAQESITKRPTYRLMQEAKLAITELGEQLTLREERFMSQWAERIPVVGRGVRASSRAYTGFLNKLRADVFDDLILKAERLGYSPRIDVKLLQKISQFVNAGTGRGNLKSFERAAVSLNTVFFSPRLMSSRLTLLDPTYYIRNHPFVRKEALKSLFSTAGMIATVLGVVKAAGGNVGLDWRSSDFGKIKIGDTRVDIMGGFQQYIRAAGQLLTGEYVSSVSGKKMTLGEGYRPITRLEILYRQIESKEAPVLSFLTRMLQGQDISGEPISLPKEVADRFIPMVIHDIYDISRDDPELLPLGALGLFGVGLQTYGKTPKHRGGITGVKRIKK